MNDLSIQIVNYKTKKYLEKCLKGLFDDLKKSDLTYEINILDNNSGDDSTNLAKKYKSQKVNFYYSDKNLGFGGGHNFLAKKYIFKYILILNPDLKFIQKNTIKRLFSKIKNDEKIKVIGPKLLTQEEKPQRWDHGQLDELLAKITNRIGHSYWRNLNKSSKVAWVSGAFLMIEKAVHDKIGGFDENFFLYKEEEDLCLRVRKTGGEVWYSPEVKIMHIGSTVARKHEHLAKSSEHFDNKHLKGRPGFLLFRTMNKSFCAVYKLTGKIFH